MSKTVFISYARADGIQLAEKLENWLESNEVGFPAFRDRTDIKPGDEWRTVIDAKIDDCFVMLVVVTPRAIEPSSYVNYEWIYALGKGKQIVSLIADASITVDKLHPRMQVLHYLSFLNPTQEDWNELKRQLIKIQAENDIPQSVVNAVAGLNSHKLDERLQAIESLKSIKHPVVVQELKRAIRHDYLDVRINVGIALAEVTDCKDDDAIPGLREALHQTERDFDRAVSLLIRMNSDIAAECLFSSFDSIQAHRKTKVSDALIQFSDPCVVPYLRALWRRQDFSRINVLEKLAYFRDDAIIGDIVKYIRSRQDHERLRVLEILVGYGNNPKIIKPFYDLLLENANLGGSYNHKIVSTILGTLEDIGSSEAIELLEQGLAKDSFRYNKMDIQTTLKRMKQKVNPS